MAEEIKEQTPEVVQDNSIEIIKQLKESVSFNGLKATNRL